MLNNNGESKKSVGAIGEELVSRWYRFKGYKILERNYRLRNAEVDIVAENSKFLCFVEVKTRKTDKFGLPSEAVNYHKRHKIILGAQYYLLKHPTDKQIRFDVAEVIGEMKGDNFKKKSINVIRGAFDNSL